MALEVSSAADCGVILIEGHKKEATYIGREPKEPDEAHSRHGYAVT